MNAQIDAFRILTLIDFGTIVNKKKKKLNENKTISIAVYKFIEDMNKNIS